MSSARIIFPLWGIIVAGNALWNFRGGKKIIHFLSVQFAFIFRVFFFFFWKRESGSKRGYNRRSLRGKFRVRRKMFQGWKKRYIFIFACKFVVKRLYIFVYLDRFVAFIIPFILFSPSFCHACHSRIIVFIHRRPRVIKRDSPNLIRNLAFIQAKDKRWKLKENGEKEWDFRGEKFAYRNLKRNKFFPKQPPSSSVFEQILPSPLSRVSLHSSLICIQDCRCSSARHLPPPLLSFLPRLLFHLPRPSFIASPPPFLPWPCEKCPKVSNNVTRFSKTSASVLETLFVEFPPCVFFFVFFTLSPPSLFSIQISSKHTRATDYKPLCTLSRGGNYWNEPCVVMTRLEMKFNWPDEKQNTRCVAVCARVRGTCVMIVTDRENSFAASCNFSSSPFLLHIYWKYKNGRFKTRSSSNDKFPFFFFFFYHYTERNRHDDLSILSLSRWTHLIFHYQFDDIKNVSRYIYT